MANKQISLTSLDKCAFKDLVRKIFVIGCKYCIMGHLFLGEEHRNAKCLYFPYSTV